MTEEARLTRAEIAARKHSEMVGKAVLFDEAVAVIADLRDQLRVAREALEYADDYGDLLPKSIAEKVATALSLLPKEGGK